MTLQSPVTQTLYAQLQKEASVFHTVIFEQGTGGISAKHVQECENGCQV